MRRHHMTKRGQAPFYTTCFCGNLFFNAAISSCIACSCTFIRVSSPASSFTRLFPCALLRSQKRMRFLSPLTTALASKHFSFHGVRLLAKKRTNFLGGLLYVWSFPASNASADRGVRFFLGRGAIGDQCPHYVHPMSHLCIHFTLLLTNMPSKN